jgi:hypothetical protein
MAIKLHDSFAMHPGPFPFEEIVKSYQMNVCYAVYAPAA